MKVGLLGVGRLGASHAETLRALPDVDDLRIYDADPARARDVAARVKARAVDTIDAALAGADAAVIVTPTDTHAPLIERCLDAKLATFCEKPVAFSVAETTKIVAQARRTRGRLQIGFQRRFDAGYRRAKDALAGGKLGPVYSFVMVSCDRLLEPPVLFAADREHSTNRAAELTLGRPGR